MGRTYHAKSKRAKQDTFDVNVSGAQLLGKIHQALNLPVFERQIPEGCDDARAAMIRQDAQEFPNTKFSMTKAECKSTAAKIRACSDADILKIERSWAFDGTDAEFVAWVREWGEFLDQCGGYEV